MSPGTTVQTGVPSHIEITETLLRLYVFLAQYLDRCLDETLGRSLQEADLQAHLLATRKSVMEMLAVNRVVKGKVEHECERILELAATCLRDRQNGRTIDGDHRADLLKAERAMLKNKTIALSDLLAVFRAM
jgi:recombinational DNA repair ATPase RecF